MWPPQPTGAGAPIDVSYLAKALSAINQLLEAADRETDAIERRALEVQAASLSCGALELLDDDTRLWNALRSQYDARAREWQEVCVPAVEDLLHKLGCVPPADGPGLPDLIYRGNQMLREAAGLPFDQDNPTAAARSVITQLRIDICKLKRGAARAQDLRKFLRAACLALYGVLLAAFINPEVQDGVRELFPHVAMLLDRLVAHMDAAFPALSAGLFVHPQQAHQLISSPDAHPSGRPGATQRPDDPGRFGRLAREAFGHGETQPPGPADWPPGPADRPSSGPS